MQREISKRVLILTADAGFGHRRAAEAIAAALDELYSSRCQPTLVNPLHAPDAPELIRQMEASYDELVVDDSVLYRIAYHATDAPIVSDIIIAATTRLLNETMVALLKEHQPDIVVTTHPAFAQPVAAALARCGMEASLAVVITDLAEVHSFWYSSAATMHFVATPQIRKQAIEHKIPPARVRVTGLPVHPSFASETRNAITLRSELGWQPDTTTGLIVSSARVRQTAAIARLLDRSGLGLQLAVVTGGDGETLEKLQREAWQGPLHLYGRVDNMAQLMKASDFIVTKAGGLVVSEAMACGLPMVLSEALPGPEAGNLRYVLEGQAGAWAPGPVEVLATVYSWLKCDYSQLEALCANAIKLGKPRAAYDIAQAVWGLA